MGTLWHGRFEGGPGEALQALNDSLPFDRRMYREDVVTLAPGCTPGGVGTTRWPPTSGCGHCGNWQTWLAS